MGSCTLLGSGRSAEVLTAWISPQDQLSDLIVDEDEETVGEGAEPPGDPEETEESVKSIRGCFKGTRTWILAEAHLKGHSLERVHAQGHTHARAVGQKGRQRCLLQEPKNQNLVPEKARKRW